MTCFTLAIKPDDVMDRLLIKPNLPEEGYSKFNTDETFVRAQEIYGVMSLPSIKDIVTSIL